MLTTDSQLLPISQISTDGGTQSRAVLNDETIFDYSEAMKIGNKFPPITVFYDGERYWLADGYHRLYAAREAGLTHVASEIKQGTLRDAIYFSCGANASHGLRRTNADKQRSVERLLKDEEWGGKPDNEIAKHCGVSQPFVGKLRSELPPSYKRFKIEERQVTRNGVTYTQNTAAIGSKTTPAEPLPRESYEPFTSAKSDEHYTPPEVIAAVLNCLGEIHLDPCSNSHIAPNVPAINHYVLEDDGLACPWKAPTLYLNPPYSEVSIWLQKLVKELDNGSTEEAIALVKADTSTRWFQSIWDNAVAVCFVHHRLAFLSDSNDGNSATFPSCLAYFGAHPDKFYHAFQEKVGVCVRVLEPEFDFGR